MKTLPVTWETFVARRRLNIKEWLFANKINTYKELISLLKERGIQPPARKEVKDYFKTGTWRSIKKPKPPKPKIVIEVKKEPESVEEEVERLSSLIVEIPEIPKSTKKRKGRPKKEYIPEDG